MSAYNQCLLKNEINFGTCSMLQEKFNEFRRLINDKSPHAPTHIEFHFKTPGGGLKAAFRIIDMMDRLRKDTGLKIHGIISKSGQCGSVATLLFGRCDSWKMHKDQELMFHAPRVQLKDIKSVKEGNMVEHKIKKIDEDTWLPLSFLEGCAEEGKELKDLSSRLAEALKRCYDFPAIGMNLDTIFAHEKDHEFKFDLVKKMLPKVELID